MILPARYNFIELHPQLAKALDTLINSDESMCIIGPGGVGKSLFIKMCVDKEIYNRETIVCTPTGISAVNVSTDNIKATTIHSLFRLPPISIIPPHLLEVHGDLIPLFRTLDTLIIDEISMVNSDLLTKIMYLLDLYRGDMKPIRLILLGDPSQLSPVVKTKDEQEFLDDTYGGRFFFHAPVFRDINILHFDKIFRQKDREFIEVLNRVRMGRETSRDLAYLNARVMDSDSFRKEGNFVYIGLTNRTVNGINERMLRQEVGQSRIYSGMNNGFKDSELPVPEIIKLTVGAQVMICVNNISSGYFNGTLATISKVLPDQVEVITSDGKEHCIGCYQWKKYSYKYDKQTSHIDAFADGTYTQIPLKLAYALTSHKTQGLTLDRIYLDLERGSFASGQCYTALSRVTSYEGLGLARKIRSKDNKISPMVKRFYKKLEALEEQK